MSDTDNSGSAFPIEGAYPYSKGLSIRDWFIAHAPAEPQPWFQPAMPPEPRGVPFLMDMTKEEREEYEGWGDYYGTEDLKCPRVRAYAEASDEYTKQHRAWNQEYEKQRYVQWPAAWADEMLRARQPRFPETFCSACGKNLGPGDSGASHCGDHS